MAGQFPAPPTYAEVVIYDETSKKAQFNPIWLKFFLDIVAVLNNSGGTTTQHNALGGLQGGTSNQYYHLTLAQVGGQLSASEKGILTGGAASNASSLHTHTGLATLTGGVGSDASSLHNHRDQVAITNIAVGASPFTYQNTSNYDAKVIVQIGTVTSIEYTRDNVNFYNVGVVAGLFGLSPGDRLRIIYAAAPTMRYIQS
jgi:hypothetical protein